MEAYWMGRDVAYAAFLTSEIIRNAEITVGKVNELLTLANMEDVEVVNSGWRPPKVNDRTKNSAGHSSHLTAEACDLRDPDGTLDKWCLVNLDTLVVRDVWLEHPGWTDGWCHIQTRPPGWPPRTRGRVPRIYVPSRKPPQTTIYGRSPIYA